VLQSQDIENLLNADSDSDVSVSESDTELDVTENVADTRVKDSSDNVNVDVIECEKDDDFVEDECWDDLANKTLDEIDEKELQQIYTPKKDEIVPEEIVVSVTTYAGDNHGPQSKFAESINVTPSTLVKPLSLNENQRQSKAAKTDEKWTPKTSVTNKKFTIEYVDLIPSARKKLIWSEKKNTKKNVQFTRLGNLSRWKKASPRRLNYDALNMKLTPQVIQSVPDPPIRQEECKQKIVSRNLFSESPQKLEPILMDAIKNAKKLQKLDPSQVRAKLGNSKLKDLRSLLSGLEGSKLRAAAAPSPSKLNSPLKADPKLTLELDVVTPRTQSPVKRVRTPVKASPRKVPAYQRYHNLSQPVNKNLSLPLNYHRLLEIFRSTDTVVSMFFNRKERITLSKLTKHTSDMMTKRWHTDMLRQIICVFPQAYNITWRTRVSGAATREMVITPNMNYKKDLMHMFDESRMDNGDQMTAATLVERRDMFRNGLLDIVKDYHEEFLSTLDPPIVADRSKLNKWHKDFEVDMVPDIDLADLPSNPDALAPCDNSEKKAADFLSINPRLSEVLVHADTINKNASDSGIFSPSKVSQSPMKVGLEGLNPSLVAKIRAKEAAKAKMEMTRSQAQLDRIALLKKLPKLARLIKNLFVSEKKVALPVDFSCKKISESLQNGVTSKDVEADLRRLCLETGGWVSSCVVKNVEYFKLQKSDINAVCNKLNRILQIELEN